MPHAQSNIKVRHLQRYCGKWVLTFAFTGMAGNEVLEWYDLDTEIKTAGLKDVREL
jgi:hypothetical protein